MGQSTKIAWCDSTWNPWIGCTKVSDGCKNCYAETLMDKRYGKVKWGKGNPRSRTSEANWKLPLKWNKDAAISGIRPRVFCASLADWLDDEVPIEWLADLLFIISQTAHLDWLLLTKRPENFLVRLRLASTCSSLGGEAAKGLLWNVENGHPLPSTIWIGTTVENQEMADKRIPLLLDIPARVRFLSCEPLLGPIDLTEIKQTVDPGFFGDCLQWYYRGKCHEDEGIQYPVIHWVICGGESGPGARPMHTNWARGLRDQCQEAGVAFHFKQQGEWIDSSCSAFGKLPQAPIGHIKNAGSFWDAPPKNEDADCTTIVKVGKHRAGRLLDGREWNEFPKIEVKP